MGTGDGLVGGEGNGVGVTSREMISPSGVAVGLGMTRGVGLGLTRGVGLTRGGGVARGVGRIRGVGVAAWEFRAVTTIANAKVTKTIVRVFINLIGAPFLKGEG